MKGCFIMQGLLAMFFLLNCLDAGLGCEDEDAAGPGALFFHLVEERAFVGKGRRTGQQAACTHAHFALDFMAADDDFDAGIVADVLFGLVEAEAGNEDFFIFSYDEVFVPGVGNMRLAFGADRGDGDDAVVFDAIKKDVG